MDFNIDPLAHPRIIRRWADDSTVETLEAAQSETLRLLELYAADETRFYLKRFLSIVEEALLEKKVNRSD